MTDMVKTDRPGQLKAYLASASQQILDVLPKGVTVERMIRTTMLAVMQNPDILACTRESILMSVMECARLGFEPGGPLGHAYLVPFRNTCQFILGYKGMIVLATRSGKVTSIEARSVYIGDDFDFRYGTSPFLSHRPVPGPLDQPIIGAYAMAHLATGGTPFQWCDVAEIDAARRRSKQRNGPWSTDYPAMAAKTAVRRLAKFLPLGDDAQRAIAEDDEREYVQDETASREDTAKNWREVLREQAERIRSAEAQVVEDQKARADEAMQDEGGKT